MPSEEDKSRIEELNTSLYSRNAPDIRSRRKLRYSNEETSLKSDWEHPAEDDVRPKELNQAYEDRRPMSFAAKFLIMSAIFCILAVGVGAYIFFNGGNLISANNIDIQISGPVSIPAGVPETFNITVQNKNNVDLELTDMAIAFPQGSADPSNSGTPLQNIDKVLGTIPAGGSVHQTVSAIIFGEENLQKEINVTLTYSVKGSSAVFTKTQSYDVLINSSPLNVTVSSYNQITSGQEFDLTVDLKSNSAQTLHNILVKGTYPFGYTLLSSSLPTYTDTSTWNIGDIPPGGERKIVLHGRLTGEDTDLRVFHFSVGTQNPGSPSTIGSEYMNVEQDMTIQKPFVSLNVNIDNDTGSGDHVGSFDNSEKVEIDWFNNLSVAVSNMVITANLSGTAYDKTTVQPDQGFFDSGANTITWNTQTNPELGTAAAGASGHLTFSITPRDLGTASQPLVNPTLVFNVNVSGNRAQEANVPQSVTDAVTRTTKIASNLVLSGRVVRSIGPFANTGLVPPKVEQPTTYTVIWDVDNTANPVTNGVMTATLPTYVKWLGQVSPPNEQVNYDPNTGTVTWQVGNVGTYTLDSMRRREVAFQISYTPSVTQAGSIPTLVNQATLSGTDTFTNTTLQSTQAPLTTRFSTDPQYAQGQETVTK
ncbi:MAG: hypothetical protein KGI59_00020 [Patescibacteria group bacterium]|nr:hypothetical protein [Patescibacteria group bacterium]MDE2172519.1 hypothetical protein [Patescibacteria group bacterium]